MHHLIDGTLEKSRVDGDHGAHPACGKPAGERDHVALRYADVKESVRESRGEAGKPRAIAHCRRQRDNPRILCRDFAKRVAEGLAPSRRRRRLLPVGWKREIHDVGRRGPGERPDAMPRRRVLLGGAVAVALLRDDVEKDRAVLLLRGGERRDERCEVVAVDRAEIVEAELLEPDVAEHHRLEAVLDPVHDPVEEREAERAANLLGDVLRTVVAYARREATKPLRDAPGRLRYRHVVVVKDDDKPLCRRRAVVERLETRAVRKRRVAYDGDDMLLAAAPVARGREPLGDGKRDARMPRYGGIGLGFGGIGKAGDAAQLAERREGVVASGEDLPGVGLVADVPHDAVGLRVEDLRKGHRDLDGAERGRKMPAVLRNGLEDPVSHFDRLHLSAPSSLRFSMSRDVAFCPKLSTFCTRS